MNCNDKRLLRWSAKVLAGYGSNARLHHNSLLHDLQRLAEQLERLNSYQSALTQCARRSWRAAYDDQARQLNYHLSDMTRTIEACQESLEQSPGPSIGLRALFEELQWLESEFDEVRLDRGSPCLCAVTPPVALEDVALGRFEIRLELNHIGTHQPAQCLRIVALDPYPAAGNSSVTHPHVQDERLCTGEAAASMKAALCQGRICDFFILARSVLQTYNEDSPYIPLAKWQGRPCYDCGYVTDDEEDNWCEGCEREFCNECFSYCRGCDASRCRGCLRDCFICGTACCDACLKTCTGCAERVCESCLKDDQCSTCHDEETNDANSTESKPDQGNSTVTAQGGNTETEPQVIAATAAA